MKNTLHTFIFLFLTIQLNAQDWQWAFGAMHPDRTELVTIRQDYTGNTYFATKTDSSGYTIRTTLEKRDVAQQILWSIILPGGAEIMDIEIDLNNDVLVSGFYTDTVSIGMQQFFTVPNNPKGFLFRADPAGNINLAKELNPGPDIFKPFDLYISASGKYYLTAEISGNEGFTSFHSLDQSGNFLRNEYNHNFENRTFTNIIADEFGNVYLSGTCGNMATFDSLTPDSNWSYQNFIVKYDSTFTAQWLHTRSYITFDHNNNLNSDGINLHWSFVESFQSGIDSAKMIKVSSDGQIIFETPGVSDIFFFPHVKHSVDSAGHNIFITNASSRLFINSFDTAYNLLWNDTIQTNYITFTGGFTVKTYSDGFYVGSRFLNDSINVGPFTIYNPIQISDVFVAKSGYGIATDIDALPVKNDFLIYPNPSSGKIFLRTDRQFLSARIFDITGREIHLINGSDLRNSIDISKLLNGVYFLHLVSEDQDDITFRFIKM